VVLGGVKERLVGPLLIVLLVTSFANFIRLQLDIKPAFLTSKAKTHVFLRKPLVKLTPDDNILLAKRRTLQIAGECGRRVIEIAGQVAGSMFARTTDWSSRLRWAATAN
jgi:hypothetical protein